MSSLPNPDLNGYGFLRHESGFVSISKPSEGCSSLFPASIGCPRKSLSIIVEMPQVERGPVTSLKVQQNKCEKAIQDDRKVSGSVMVPVVKSQTGKAFLRMLPREVLLASLDAINKVLDVVEAAEKQALSATSNDKIPIFP
ncbi:Senescence/spartin-associated protein [Spatholobus suberectus]|nr:Senescence/spartin-associated protein [Spatholobus suberectus]